MVAAYQVKTKKNRHMLHMICWKRCPAVRFLKIH